MALLTVGLDLATARFLEERSFTLEAIPQADFDLGEWVNDDGLYEAAVVNLDVTGGVYLCRGLRERGVKTPVLGLMSPGEQPWSESRATFLEHGGDDLLRQPVNARELAASIRSTMRRYRGGLTSIYTCRLHNWVLKVNQSSGLVTLDGRTLHLTGQERKMMELLAAGAGKVFSKEQFLSAMYTNAVDEPEIKIIDVFICKLRKKLNDEQHGAGAFIQTIWGRGYTLVNDIGLAERGVAA